MLHSSGPRSLVEFLYRALRYFWGRAAPHLFQKKASRRCYFSETSYECLYPFINKSVLLKSTDSPQHSSSSSSSSSINLFPFFFQVSISFYKSCDILCIFKQLIRVLLCFYSRDYVLLSSMLLLFSSLLFEKELLPKETFFVTRNYGNDTVCATHDARLCHVCSITTRKRKRRSWANFRRRYITRKLIFPAYILDLGLANDIYLIKIGHM